MAAGQPVPVPAEGEVVGRSCPICQTQIVRGELAVACPGCRLDYHDDCWKSNSGCGAYGCSFTPETIKAKVDENRSWGGEKTCPGCRRKIRAELMECSSCDAVFWTREAISPEAWANRELTGRDFERARNLSLLVFLLSVMGCSFPIMAPYTGFWIWGGGGPYPYARLPEGLKILLKAGFAASILWGVILLLLLVTSTL
jgi:Prokaryotic RING finger family 1